MMDLSLPQELEELKQDFMLWREHKGHGAGRIPKVLWQKAAALIPRYPRYKICRVASINSQSFNKKFPHEQYPGPDEDSQTITRPPPNDFLQVHPPSHSSGGASDLVAKITLPNSTSVELYQGCQHVAQTIQLLVTHHAANIS